MAEGQSEDYPLLGDVDAPSPSRSTPSSRKDTKWTLLESQCPEASDDTARDKDNATNSLRNYHKPVVIHHPSWPSSASAASLPIAVAGADRLSPKTVHSQSSMDSGCDCDPSEVESQEAARGAATHNKSATVVRPPLLPKAGGVVEVVAASPLPHLTVTTTQSSAPECHCDTNADQKYCCDNPPAASSFYSNSHATTVAGAKNQTSTKVTFKIEGGSEADVVYDDILCCSRYTGGPTMTINAIEVDANVRPEPEEAKGLSRVVKTFQNFPRVSSFTKPGMLSSSSSTASMPMCRICHLPQGEGLDMLISPCRCAGTMQFIHEGCLTKWLEISAKRAKKSPTCELCNYQFNRHKKFRLRHWKLPSCSFVDKILHVIFLLCIVVMATSASITIYCFKQDKFIRKREDTDLTQSEIITLTCGVLFFVAFFVAMYVEVRAKDTIYRLLSRFLYLNQTWHIGEYDKTKDMQACHSPV